MFEERIISNRLVPLLKPKFNKIKKKAKPHSMVSRKRMQNLWRILHRITRNGLEGDFVELGVAHGGTAMLLATVAQEDASSRHVWLYDAFEELGDCDATYDKTFATLFEDCKFDRNQVHLIKGWFHETVPARPKRPVALLHIDASGYEAVKAGLELLDPEVVSGGWFVFDNYGVDEGCRNAVKELIEHHEKNEKVQRFGSTQAYFQKA